MFKNIDHVAVVVPELDEAIQLYGQCFDWKLSLRERNEEQGFEVAAFQVGDASFELLSPTRPDSVIAGFLSRKGPGIHHIGLKVDDISQSVTILKKRGLKFTSEEPRRGSDDTLINFIHPKSFLGTMFEIVEHRATHFKEEKRSQSPKGK
jgi:methylmalonyl-CoA/ethylmalonyl-CoA epimerase